MASKKHILLKYASTYEIPREANLTPKGFRYDFDVGAWISPVTKELLVSTPEGPKPITKKKDIETGEDQKGE